MRRGGFAAMLLAALFAAGMQADAQVRLKLLPQQRIQMQKPPRVAKPPRVGKPQQVKPPPLVIIKPSVALKIAARAVPGGKALSVKLLNNNTYAVTLRQNNVVTRVMVDATTGAVN